MNPSKPIFILHTPKIKDLTVPATMEMFRDFLEKEIGQDYHVIVLPIFDEVNFKTECYFVEKIEQKTIDEINAKIKNHYEQ